MFTCSGPGKSSPASVRIDVLSLWHQRPQESDETVREDREVREGELFQREREPASPTQAKFLTSMVERPTEQKERRVLAR